MHSLDIFRPIMNIDQTVIDRLAAAADSVGIEGLKWRAAGELHVPLIGPGELSGVLRAAGVNPTYEQIDDLADEILDDLPSTADNDALPVATYNLEVGPVFVHKRLSLRRLAIAANNPTIVLERQAIRDTVEREFELTNDGSLWVPRPSAGVELARSKTPGSLEALEEILRGDRSLLPELTVFGHPIVRDTETD